MSTEQDHGARPLDRCRARRIPYSRPKVGKEVNEEFTVLRRFHFLVSDLGVSPESKKPPQPGDWAWTAMEQIERHLGNLVTTRGVMSDDGGHLLFEDAVSAAEKALTAGTRCGRGCCGEGGDDCICFEAQLYYAEAVWGLKCKKGGGALATGPGFVVRTLFI